MNRTAITTSQTPCSRRAGLPMVAAIDGLAEALCGGSHPAGKWAHERSSLQVSFFGFDYPTPIPGGEGA